MPPVFGAIDPGKLQGWLIARHGPRTPLELISEILDPHQGVGLVDHPVAVGTDDRQVAEPGTHRRADCRKRSVTVDLAELGREIPVESLEIKPTCFTSK
jgi:hypothetical protein